VPQRKALLRVLVQGKRETRSPAEQVSGLPRSHARVVVINVATDLTTALAIASARRYVDAPVLLINCDPSDTSRRLMDRLASRLQFDIVEAPRQAHGRILDWVFRSIPSDIVVLLDSDAEIRSDKFVRRRLKLFKNRQIFGAGFTLVGPSWLPKLDAESGGLLMEQMWTPCLFLRRSYVVEALEAGVSFCYQAVYNDIRWSPTASRLLAKRFDNEWVESSRSLQRLPAGLRKRLRTATFPRLRWARRSFRGFRPNYVIFDTGAAIFEYCRYQRYWVFVGSNIRLLDDDEVYHYGGVTRDGLDTGLVRSKRRTDAIQRHARLRLRAVYGIDWDELIAGT
jgi:hypothetical protein